MNTPKDQKFVTDILTKLTAMNNVQISKEITDIVSLVKEDLKFGEVVNNKLKLLGKDGKYHLVDNTVIKDNDLLLREATHSYWIAAGKK